MRRLPLLLCLVSLPAVAQNGGVLAGTPTITNTRGEPVPFATVAICITNPGASPSMPCNGPSNLAALSTDITLGTLCSVNVSPPGPIGGTGCTNPGTSDGLGNVVAFAQPGVYYCEYYGGSIVQPIVVPCFFASGGSGPANSQFIPIPNCPTTGTVLHESVQLGTNAGAVCATLGTLGSTSVIGSCAGSCGTTGTAQVAYQNFQNVIMDGTSTANDYIAPSTSVVGFFTDTGVPSSSSPPGTVETCGIVGTPNAGGGGNPANVLLSCLALFAGGPKGTGSITPCSVNGCNIYEPTANLANVTGDNQFTENGSGTFTAVGGIFDGAGAGFIAQVQGTAPSLNLSNSVYLFPPTSVGTTYGLSWPGSLPTNGHCVQFSVSGSIAQFTDAGAACGAGSGSVTSVGLSINSASSSGPFAVTGSPVTTSGTLNLNATLQGTDAKLLTSGTISGTGAALCTDANGGATTSGCPSGSTTTITTYLGPQDCNTDQTGNVTYDEYDYGGSLGVNDGNHDFDAHWRFLAGQSASIYCKTRVPHAVAGTPNAQIILNIRANDANSGHTATFQTCDAQITTNYHVTSFSCASAQTFTTTSTAYALDTLTYSVQTSVTADDILKFKVTSGTSGTQPNHDMEVDVYVRFDQSL